MIESELILLGLLKENPKHGYEIKTRIKEILSLFAGVDIKSVYYPLAILEKMGLVEKKAMKNTKRPLRLVYALTKKGEARFDKLLSESFLNFKRPQFSLDLSLYFLNYAKPRIVRRRLRARLLILKNLSAELQQMVRSFKGSKPPALSRILEHNLWLLEAESKFLAQLIKSI